ncbi:hypothetical protein AVEN_127526-1 [Araneus ventricosus]|uniref:Uncharacterized protein n=1 Tax=Araneus ventricosus TaxID=182803 RepID=A0A4Y2MJA6_ARAVE|nr:hypothetical protein AVEN_127526-1 [Araneus ventricosus]
MPPGQPSRLAPSGFPFRYILQPMNLIKTLSKLSNQRRLERNAVLPHDPIYQKEIQNSTARTKNQCDSVASEESLDSEVDSVNMLVDDALRDAAKDPSPTTTRKIASLPPQKSPMQSSSTRDSKAKRPIHYG